MSDTDTQELIINSVLAYTVYAINKSTRANLVTVLDASFTDKEVSDACDVLSPVGCVELLGKFPGRNDSTKCSRHHAICCDIYDAMRKMDAADVKMPTYVVDSVGIGRLPKYSPEDLNVVAMDQCIRDLDKHCMTVDATLTMKTSHYDVLEDHLNVVKLAVEQHTTRFRAMEHPRKGAKRISHIHSIVPQQTYSANTIIPSPSVLSSEMTNHAETPSVPVRSEQRDETDTMVDINFPSTSTVTAVITHPLPACPERSTGLAPSYSQLAKNLKLNPAGIRTDDFADFQPARKRRPKAKLVSGKTISGNTFKGGPTTRNVFLFRVNRDVSEDIVKDPSSVPSEPTYLSELQMRVKTSVRNICQHNYYCMQHCHFVNSTQSQTELMIYTQTILNMAHPFYFIVFQLLLIVCCHGYAPTSLFTWCSYTHPQEHLNN